VLELGGERMGDRGGGKSDWRARKRTRFNNDTTIYSREVDPPLRSPTQKIVMRHPFRGQDHVRGERWPNEPSGALAHARSIERPLGGDEVLDSCVDGRVDQSDMFEVEAHAGGEGAEYYDGVFARQVLDEGVVRGVVYLGY
jgi:hypothetical protein